MKKFKEGFGKLLLFVIVLVFVSIILFLITNIFAFVFLIIFGGVGIILLIALIMKTSSKVINKITGKEEEYVVIPSKNIKNYHKKDDSFIGEIYSALFDKDIKIYVDEDVDVVYAEKCVFNFNNLKDEVIDDICEAAIRYYKDIVESTGGEGIDVPKKVKGRDILKYINPVSLSVNKAIEDVVGFHVECECDWEEEHGLEFTIKDNKLLYLGTVDNITAWEGVKKYQDDMFNYANKK